MNPNASLIKKVITEVTFRESVSTPDDVRSLQLKYDSEGAGRHFVLSDGCRDGAAICLHHPDDFKLLWETAIELWNQGSIFAESEDW